MAKKKRTRRRKSSSVRRALSSPKRKTTRRRRKKGLLSSAGLSMTGITNAVKHNGVGALGGALFLMTRAVPMPNYLRPIVGFGGSILLSTMAKSPMMAAGMAGATAYYLGDKIIPKFMPNLLNDDFEDGDWVDADTLSDTGYVDANGNAIMQDGDGVYYQLNDAGELEASGMQGTTMAMLDDPYDLSGPYDLADGY